MRVHLSALLALVSVTGYVACGSSDGTRATEEGGAGGEGGEAIGAGGSNAVAGSNNTGGSNTNAAGEGGAPIAIGGMPATEAGAGGADLGEVGGAGGAGPDPSAIPAACLENLTIEGTSGPDTFTNDQLNMNNSHVNAIGYEGDDVFEYNYAGQDCLVGGAGDDDLSAPGEYGSYLMGNEGADVFHFTSQFGGNTPSIIVDMSAEDELAFNKTNFMLAGAVGMVLYAQELASVVDYEAGTGMIPNGEGACIVYDPATGGIWRDTDRGDNSSGAGKLAVIENHASYVFDPNDFVVE